MKKEDVDNMTLQEACDFAAFQMVNQGGRCLCISRGKCSYGRHNNHCPVGWLLDENNNKLMRYSGAVSALVEDHAKYIPDLIKDNLDTFRALQALHDTDDIKLLAGTLKRLTKHIDVSKPQYQAWVDLRTKQMETA